jgi:hypothetical protein
MSKYRYLRHATFNAQLDNTRKNVHKGTVRTKKKGCSTGVNEIGKWYEQDMAGLPPSKLSRQTRSTKYRIRQGPTPPSILPNDPSSLKLSQD